MIKLLILIVGVLAATPYNTNRVLIVADSPVVYISHSILFNQLKDMGYKLDFKSLQSTTLNLQIYGEWQYDHVIIFSTEKNVHIAERDFLDFYDAGKNILLIGSPNQSKYFRKLVNSFGLDYHEKVSINLIKTTLVTDFFNNQGQHENVLTYNNFFGISKPIGYYGQGMSLTPYETNQVWGLLRGSETAVSNSILSHNIIYVGATQGRNNARFVATGGYDILCNDLVSKDSLGNLEFLQNTVRWAFSQSMILKIDNIVHKRANSTDIKPHNYKVSEDVYFGLEIQIWNYQANQWVPYVSDADDVILEFTMLDPYYRIPLKKGKGSLYEIDFKLPDKYGVFQFKINYQKPGYTFLKVAEKVTVRPLRHDEHPRYLTQAIPYYLSSFATIAGFIVFVITYLFNDNK